MAIDYVRLHHIQLCIPPRQEEVARDFYLKILGFIEIEKPPSLKGNGGFWLKVADIEVHIGVEANSFPGKKHPAFQIRNIKMARLHLMEHNVAIQEETKIDGYERFSFYDPFRNRIEFISPIK
ncbi:MAG: VOC family protein [Anaerobacillus sp.]